MDFSLITPCGECCVGCEKRTCGLCRGCLETGGHCEEWAQSGQCPTYACCKEHNVPFCGVCPEFPCDHLPMLKWRPDCVRELTEQAEAYRKENTMDMTKIKQNAIDWALARVGKAEYAGWCLSFIEDAVEKSNGIELFGGDCAKESAMLYQDGLRIGVPETGAFVFYDCCGTVDGKIVDWGHCGLCIGEGKVIHAWDKVRVDDYLALEQLSPAPGWTAPRYLGWVPLERVLAQKP